MSKFPALKLFFDPGISLVARILVGPLGPFPISVYPSPRVSQKQVRSRLPALSGSPLGGVHILPRTRNSAAERFHTQSVSPPNFMSGTTFLPHPPRRDATRPHVVVVGIESACMESKEPQTTQTLRKHAMKRLKIAKKG